MIRALVPPVRLGGEASVELTHPVEELALVDLQDDVVVVRHQTVRDDAPTVAQGRPHELADEEPPAPVPKVDRLTIVTAGVHVVVRAGNDDSGWPSHRRRR